MALRSERSSYLRGSPSSTIQPLSLHPPRRLQDSISPPTPPASIAEVGGRSSIDAALGTFQHLESSSGGGKNVAFCPRRQQEIIGCTSPRPGARCFLPRSRWWGGGSDLGGGGKVAATVEPERRASSDGSSGWEIAVVLAGSQLRPADLPPPCL